MWMFDCGAAALSHESSPTMDSMSATDGFTTPPEAFAVMKMMTVSTTSRHMVAALTRECEGVHLSM